MTFPQMSLIALLSLGTLGGYLGSVTLQSKSDIPTVTKPSAVNDDVPFTQPESSTSDPDDSRPACEIVSEPNDPAHEIESLKEVEKLELQKARVAKLIEQRSNDLLNSEQDLTTAENLIREYFNTSYDSVAATQAGIPELQDKADGLRQDTEEAHSSAKSSRDKTEVELKKALKVLGDIKVLNQDIEKLDKKHKRSLERLKSTQTAYKEATNRVTTFEQDVIGMEDKIGRHKRTIKRLRHSIVKLRVEIKDLEGKVAQMRAARRSGGRSLWQHVERSELGKIGGRITRGLGF